MTTTTREVPANALRFSVPCQFAKDASTDPMRHRITGLARSSEAIYHWYWGRVVHDFAGMKPRGEKLHLDYCHWELIGVVDQLSVQTDGLHIGGEVQSIKPDDQALTVITRGKLGSPYELSIDFTDPAMRIEEVAEGVPVVVNGQQFTGPLTVIREWELRSVAVCEYGRDSNTEAKFSEGQAKPPVTITVLSQEKPMKLDTATTPAAATPPTDAAQLGGNTTPGAPAAPAATPQPAAVPGANTFSMDQLKKYTEAFGAEKGLAHFTAGTPFETALATEYKALQTKLSAKDGELEQTKTALESTKLGGEKPVGASDTAPGAGTAPSTSQFAYLGGAGSAFATEIQNQMAKK